MSRITTAIATLALAAAALAPASSTAAPAPTAAKAPAKAYKVTAKANKSVAISKETIIKVKGKVSPKAAGETVTLEQRVDGKKKWKKTGTAKVKGNGKYLLKDKPSAPGVREYRVVKAASKGLRKGVSKTLEVGVYVWRFLAWSAPGPKVNMSMSGLGYVGAKSYHASLITDVAGTPSSIEYTLGRKCTQLQATYAMNDTAASGSTGAVSVSADGTVRATHGLSVGSIVENHKIDVTDVFRIKFDLTTTAEPAGVAVVASPKVLCLN